MVKRFLSHRDFWWGYPRVISSEFMGSEREKKTHPLFPKYLFFLIRKAPLAVWLRDIV